MAEILHEGNIWHLRNRWISYAVQALPGGVLAQLYAGARLERINPASLMRRAGVNAEGFSVQECALERLPQEYPSFGLGDMREGALTVEGPDGSCAVDLRLVSGEILS